MDRNIWGSGRVGLGFRWVFPDFFRNGLERSGEASGTLFGVPGRLFGDVCGSSAWVIPAVAGLLVPGVAGLLFPGVTD